MQQDSVSSTASSDELGRVDEDVIETGDGRRIVVWRTCAVTRDARRGTILLAPGFCRRMYNLATLAQYLTFNGFEVYRYDPLNHLGPSSGVLYDFTMSSGYYGMNAVLSWLRGERDVDSLGIVATSLSARHAYRACGERHDIDYLLTAVGVTHLRATLQRVFGVDWAACERELLAPTVVFEDKHVIHGPPFWEDAYAGDWWEGTTTQRELDSVDIPIVAFAARDDDWVQPHEVEAALGLSRHRERRLCELAGSGHNVSQNPAVAQAMLVSMTGEAMGLAAGFDRPLDVKSEPTFTQITEQIIKERRLSAREGS